MFQDVGAGVHVVDALAGQTAAVQATATGNADSLNGLEVDLRDDLPRKYNSVKVAVLAEQSLASGRTFSFVVNLQNRSATTGAGSTWANFGTTGRAFSVSTSATGRSLHEACFEGEGVWRAAKRYVRIQVVPSGSNTIFIDSSSTAGNASSFRFKAGAFIFGTPDEMPASG